LAHAAASGEGIFSMRRKRNKRHREDRESHPGGDIICLSGILETYEFIKAPAHATHVYAASGRAAAAALVSLFLAA
jgi:hypothetical protein